MWKSLRRLNNSGITIILTTHYLEEAEQLCRNLAIINHGRIIENALMSEISSKLDDECFELILDSDLPKALDLTPFGAQKTSGFNLQVTLNKHHTLDELFALLATYRIKVRSIHNRTRHLEELFLKLTQGKE